MRAIPTELLRRSAEDTLVLLVRALAERLPSALDEAISGNTPSSSSFSTKDSAKIVAQAQPAFRPFSLPSILESLRVLVSIIDPRNRHTHTDSVHRVVALGLLCVFVEHGGPSVSRWVQAGREAKARAAARPPPKKKALPVPSDAAAAQPTEGTIDPITPEGEESRGRSREIKPVIEPLPATTDQPQQQQQQPLEIHLETPQPGTLGEQPTADGEDLQMEPEAPPPYDDEDAVHLPALQLLSDDMPRFLFYLLRTDHFTFASPPTPVHLTVLQLTLRCLAGLFGTARGELRCQYEWMVGSVIQRGDQGVVAWDVEGKAPEEQAQEKDKEKHAEMTFKLGHAAFPVTGEVRELLLETLLQFARAPTFAAELWLNYDGDLGSPGHLLEESVKFLSRHGFPDVTPGGPVTTPIHQSLCLDGLLLFLKHMVERRGETVRVDAAGNELPSAEELRNNKARKRALAEGTEKFNADPKEGIAYLQQLGFVPSPPTPESLAHFLLQTPGVNKKLIGDYISKPSNLEVLKAFIGQYDFRGKRVDEALRTMLESFRLPGEAQQIERIMENFAEKYFDAIKEDEAKEIETQDATFVLAYSVIMLNTDQHNPQVRVSCFFSLRSVEREEVDELLIRFWSSKQQRRMTLEDFQRNTRGVNNGKNFSPEYLAQIYDAIRERAIVMPEEHDGELGLNYAWKELLKRAAVTGNSMKMPSAATNAYDGDMLAAVWAPTVAAISYGGLCWARRPLVSAFRADELHSQTHSIRQCRGRHQPPKSRLWVLLSCCSFGSLWTHGPL